MERSSLSSSGHIFLVARNACQRSATSDRWDALSAMTLSVIGLECFVNEFTERLDHDFMHQGIPQLMDVAFALNAIEDSRGSLATKLEAIVYYVTRRKLDWGQLPFQDLRVLLRIRNKLVHRKTEKIDYDFENPGREYTPHKDVAYLVSRKVIDAPHVKSPSQWGAYVVCPEVAAWAYGTVVESIGALIELLPKGNFAKVMELTSRDLQISEPDEMRSR